MNIDKILNSLSFKFPYDSKEWEKNLIMENYHSHTDFSNISTPDSPTKIGHYAKRTKELGGKCLFGGEHGSQGNVFENYECAENNGLLYVHSSEVYWVKDRHEQDNANCHMMIVALNDDGRKELNYILSMANIDGYYYKPRIDLELLFSLNPKNFIVTSACIAGWKYEDADEIWIKVHEHFGNHFFLEVQPHNTKSQSELNMRILYLARHNNIDIICGLDSHYIDSSKDDIKRNKILEYKKIFYEDEDGWNLDYPDGKTVFDRFMAQGVLTEEQTLRAMANTNIFSVLCEKIVFNKKFKIPVAYPNTTYEERAEIYKNLLWDAYEKEPIHSKEREEGIEYESKQVIEAGVVDYFLTGYKFIKDAVENEGGVLTTTSRGSMGSFYTNKLLGLTTLDRFNSEIPLYPDRFLTKDRVLAGQMPDADLNLAEQEPFVRSLKKICGEHGVYPLMAIEKLKEKAAWQLYAGANGIEPSVANEISKYIDRYNEALKYAEEDEKDNINVESYIPEEYLSTFLESRDYQGITINLKVHACGHLIFDGDIRKEIGLISAISETTGKRTLCVACEGGYLDSYGYVKEDLLIVDVVSLIHECYSKIGMKVPSFNELRKMVENDNKTWDIYKNGITCCVNQCEKEKTTERVKIYKPKNIEELSGFIAGIRPGFMSLLDTYINRKSYTTGEEVIDELLAPSSNFMLYQESLMSVLNFLDVPMSETYGIIKSISKKKLKGEKKKNLEDKLMKSWLNKIGNLDNFEKVWKVFSDASNYSFNCSHSLSMAGDSAYIAWFKSHYPEEFYEVAINHYQKKGNKSKIDSLMKEINTFYGYELGEYKFRTDNRAVNISKENKVIYPTMTSLKGFGEKVAEKLYEIKDNEYDSFFDLLEDFTKYSKEIKKNHIETLISIDYFSEFGNPNQLKRAVDLYNHYWKRKQISKKAVLPEAEDFIRKFSQNETDKMFTKIDGEKLCKALYASVSVDTDIYELCKAEAKVLGYCNRKLSGNPFNIITDIEINNWGTPFVTLHSLHSGNNKTFKFDKKLWDGSLEIGDAIKVAIREKDKKKKTDDGKWVVVGSELIITAYATL